MAIFRVIESGYDSPDEIEAQLTSESRAVTATNVNGFDSFSAGCAFWAKHFNTCITPNSLKYKHYVQGFPPEDNKKMNKAQCHALGVEAARTLWPDFPVLVVSHYDQPVEGSTECHWHSHFIVYNCAVTDGHKLDTTRAALWAQKRFVAAQADNHGLTRKGLILENGRIRESTREVGSNDYIRKQMQTLHPDNENALCTQKAMLRMAIQTACVKTDDFDDFCRYLKEHNNIETKVSRGAVSFLHPERRWADRAWIRGATLGDLFTKEAIEHELATHDRWRSVNKDTETEAERFERYRSLYKFIYGDGNAPKAEAENPSDVSSNSFTVVATRPSPEPEEPPEPTEPISSSTDSTSREQIEALSALTERVEAAVQSMVTIPENLQITLKGAIAKEVRTFDALMTDMRQRHLHEAEAELEALRVAVAQCRKEVKKRPKRRFLTFLLIFFNLLAMLGVLAVTALFFYVLVLQMN